MKEKLMSLSLVQLRDIAKREGLKKISALRKAELVDRLVEYEEQKSRDQSDSPAEEAAEQAAGSKENDAKKGNGRRKETSDDGFYSAKSEPERSSAAEKHALKKDAGKKNAPSENGKAKSHVSRMPEKNYTKKYRSARASAGSDKGKNNVHVKHTEKNDLQVKEKDSYSVRFHTHHTDNSESSGEHLHKQRGENRDIIQADSGENRPERGENHAENRSQQHGENQKNEGIPASGILEVLPDGYGFIRCENYLPGENDVYVSPSLIRRFNLKTGDIITGNTKAKSAGEKFGALLFVSDVNGFSPFEAQRRMSFENMTPVFPNERIHLETKNASVSMRIMDLIAPVGKGQRGMIVSPPKAGKTTLLKEVAKSVIQNNPEIHIIILLIDERPEEVTDMKEDVEGENVEVIYSTFDELAEHHKRVSEMVIERAKRLVEHHKDVMILLDSITRLARAYNLVVPPSGRTLSGGLDPAALHMPKRFFGAARNMREGGSLTILATALVDTGSKMDDVVYEEFKGTGNMELVLDRNLSERRIFPAIDIVKSGTRRDDLLLSPQEQETMNIVRRNINGMKTEEAVETILHMFVRTKSNEDFVKFFLKKKYS